MIAGFVEELDMSSATDVVELEHPEIFSVTAQKESFRASGARDHDPVIYARAFFFGAPPVPRFAALALPCDIEDWLRFRA